LGSLRSRKEWIRAEKRKVVDGEKEEGARKVKENGIERAGKRWRE